MNESSRRKSPRAPSISLDEALERVARVHASEGLDPVPNDRVAQLVGYKSANNGSALSLLASLRYYGLMDRAGDGQMAVQPRFEAYSSATDEKGRRAVLIQCLRSPPIFLELLERYASGLPADPTLHLDLNSRGFTLPAAGLLIAVFRRSVAFVEYFDRPEGVPEANDSARGGHGEDEASGAGWAMAVSGRMATDPDPLARSASPSGADQIPVRLTGGRRAWLVLPTPFYAADKVRLKAQLDLVLADDEEP